MSAASPMIAMTGTTGFVGERVLNALLQRGYSVRGLVRDPGKFVAPGGSFTAVKGDLADPAALAELVVGADVVIHLVGIIAEAPSEGQTFEAVHYEGTVALLAAAKKAGVKRWVHMSALGTRPDAVSNYHRTKWRAEEAVRASGLAWTIIRPSMIHGPKGEFVHMVKEFWTLSLMQEVARFLGGALTLRSFNPPLFVPSANWRTLFIRQAVPYFGGGLLGSDPAGKIQPVFVDDVATVFAEAVARDKTIEETYGLGGPEEFTWRGLYTTMKKFIPGARDKVIIGIPAWQAKLLTHVPFIGARLPFNWDQVVMSQEDSICNLAKVRADFGVEPGAFEETFAAYAGQIP
jgi:uncharacterized protein YbjT (DUF2867 family)